MNNEPLPHITIGNNELGEPAGETIECLFCKQQHPIEYADSRTPLDNGEWSEPEVYKQLGFYKCGDQSYLASVDGRLLK